MDKEQIGKFIRSLRLEKNMKQQDLANTVFISRQAVSLWERGKAIPDSSILCLLSDFFGVSVNEILKGEKVTHETKKDLEEITLKMVDECNKRTLNTKRIIKIFTTAILFLIVIFLIYYFLSSYNSIKVYKINGKGTNFFTNNGIIINTRQKSYIRLGKLNSLTKYNIEKVELYYIKNNKKIIIYKDTQSDILLTENYGYDEYFSSDDFKYILKSLYLEIIYDSSKKDTINLNVEKDFSNNKIIYSKKYNDVKLNNEKKIINKFKQTTKLLELKDTVIFYQTQRKNEKIYFQFNNNILLITSTSKKNNIEEIWYIYTNDNTLIEYKKYNDTKEISHKYLSQSNITNDNKKEYEKLMQIIEIYLKNKKSK